MAPSAGDGRADGMAPMVAVLDCGPAEAALHIAALVDLADRLGSAARMETVSAACTTLSVRLAPEHAARFRAALLLGGATFVPTGSSAATDVTVIVTISGRPLWSD